jgi:hypothetical protein
VVRAEFGLSQGSGFEPPVHPASVAAATSASAQTIDNRRMDPPRHWRIATLR